MGFARPRLLRSESGYDSDDIKPSPEGKPSLEILQRDTNAPRRSEERDDELTETASHSWQRPAAGRRAKLPDELRYQEPSLIEAAERCRGSLEKLKKHANDSKARYSHGTKKRQMLDKVDSDVCPFTVQYIEGS